VSLGEELKSFRRQGGGVGDRAAVTPLQRRHSGSFAFGKWLLGGHRQMGVVGGSGDQDGCTQGQQNRDSRMKNIFFGIEIKHDN